MCISQEIPAIENQVHQAYPQDQVECIGICDEMTSQNLDNFLVPYIKGNTPYNSIPTTFNVLYDAGEAIDAYGLSAHSTWIIIDQERRVVFRENDNIDPEVIDEVIEVIEGLL